MNNPIAETKKSRKQARKQARKKAKKQAKKLENKPDEEIEIVEKEVTENTGLLNYIYSFFT